MVKKKGLLMEKDSKIYVAGHTGLVGSALKRKLEEQGFTNLITCELEELDLRRQQPTEDFFQKYQPDYVFLAAAKVGGILANSTYKADFIYDNILIASNVINTAYQNSVKKLINLGSSCIYPRLSPQPMKEEYLLTGPLEPTNEPYAIAKIAAIKLCRYYNEQYGTQFLSVMPTNLYGKNDNYHLINSHVLPALIRKLHLGKLLSNNRLQEIKQDLVYWKDQVNVEDESAIRNYLQDLLITADKVGIWGTGEVYREFLHVDDMADACVYIMNQVTPEQAGEVINIGTGQDLTIKDLAFLIKDIVGFPGELFFDTSKPDGMPRKKQDITKLSALGWTNKIPLKDGIQKTYQEYCKVFSIYT